MPRLPRVRLTPYRRHRRVRRRRVIVVVVESILLLPPPPDSEGGRGDAGGGGRTRRCCRICLGSLNDLLLPPLPDKHDDPVEKEEVEAEECYLHRRIRSATEPYGGLVDGDDGRIRNVFTSESPTVVLPPSHLLVRAYSALCLVEIDSEEEDGGGKGTIPSTVGSAALAAAAIRLRTAEGFYDDAKDMIRSLARDLLTPPCDITNPTRSPSSSQG